MPTSYTPVLAIPYLAGNLRSCVESIDMDVRLIIIDNSPDGDSWDQALDVAHIIDLPGNIGYTAAINLVIKTLPHEPYWLFANHDVVFGPGDLRRLTDTEGYGWVGIEDWRVFKLTAETVERVGLWDENFWPAYCEDADYERRCDLAGIRRGFIEGSTTHVSSAVIKEFPEYARANARSYPQNVRYYAEKWGAPGVRMPGAFDTPHGEARWLGDWSLDLSRVRAQSWDRDRGAG